MGPKESRKLNPKYVIARDTLPMNFPHYTIIYAILIGVTDWANWIKVTLWLLCLGWVLVYIARKFIEKPEIKLTYLEKDIKKFMDKN